MITLGRVVKPLVSPLTPVARYYPLTVAVLFWHYAVWSTGCILHPARRGDGHTPQYHRRGSNDDSQAVGNVRGFTPQSDVGRWQCQNADRRRGEQTEFEE